MNIAKFVKLCGRAAVQLLRLPDSLQCEGQEFRFSRMALNAAPTNMEMYLAYLTAELKIIGGAKSYQMGDRSVTREDLQWIQAGRREYEKKNGVGRRRPVQVRFRDL